MKALKMCLNWKVIAGVAAAGVGLFVFAPGLAAAALPFLVLAICPLSMVFMMGAMNGNGMGQTSSTGAEGGQQPRNRNERLAELEMQQQALADQIAMLETEDDARLEHRPSAEAVAQPS